MKLFHKIMSNLRGHNTDSTPVNVIMDQMEEKRPLPLGMTEFEEWSDRIISGALLSSVVPGDQKFALASMIMNLSPTCDHECDAYFIKSLRKNAINQIAHTKMNIYHKAAKDRIAAEEAAKAAAVVSESLDKATSENHT